MLFWKKKPEAAPQNPKNMQDKTLVNKLGKAIQIAINALKSDMFPYRWSAASSCNCGVVVTAMLNGSILDTQAVFNLAYSQAKNIGTVTDLKKKTYTWQQMAQISCSITGEPLTNVFMKFNEMGFSVKDVVHLEYMTNAAILKDSGINTKVEDYYTIKDNLILYLESWNRILTGKHETATYSKKEALEADLLIAIAEEKYEHAARIKKELVTL